MKRRLWILLLGVFFMAGMSPSPWPDRGAAASAGGNDLDYRLRGHVVPSRQVELDSPLEEIVRSIEVKESEEVKAGQILTRMDDRLQQVVVDAARVRADSGADVKRAELDLENAQMNYERMQSAFDNNAATDMESRRSRITRDSAQAALTAANENRTLSQVNLQLEEERLQRYHVKAPFDGTVIRIIAESGSRLNDNDPILLLADLATLEAHINLPVEMYGQLDVDRAYRFHAEQPVNAEITGTLRMITPLIDTASQTFRCVFSIDNSEAKMPAGFTVYLKWPN